MKKMKILLPLLCCLCLLCACGKEKGTDPVEAARQAVEKGTAPDFEALKKADPLIIAWLTIPGTPVSDPIRQDADNENALSEYSLYTQAAYNSPDFTDPAAVVYGPLTSDGSLFGALQRTFSEDGSLERCGNIIVYIPEGALRYRAFAASLYNSTHLLHACHGLQSSADRTAFLDSLKSYHVMSRQWDESIALSESERLLVLSAHTPQNEDLRYLVLTKSVSPAG